MMTSDTQRTIEAIWRIESAKLIAALARLVRDVGLAEDLAQDALVIALERWPKTGVPDKPGAWLMATAKHRAIDRIRRNVTLERKHEELGRELVIQQEMTEADFDAALDTTLADDVGDDLLRLIFMACHPVLSTEARVALTLRLLGGLTTDEIARAFLVSEATVAQRIVRAKRTLAEARVPFEVPRGADRDMRLSSVLEVIYLIFNEGYAATAGESWVRPTLCEDALRLGRILAELVSSESDVHGLVALMEIQASRLRARVGPAGDPILLLDQNHARWDQLLIRRGLAALERANATALGSALGPYALQAATPGDVLAEIYSGPKAELRPIHDKLLAAIEKFGAFEIAPKKNYVSLRRKKQFAMISPATKTRVEVGINVKGLKPTARLIEMPAGGMCQYKVNVTAVGEVDKELIAWIRQAYDNAV